MKLLFLCSLQVQDGYLRSRLGLISVFTFAKDASRWSQNTMQTIQGATSSYMSPKTFLIEEYTSFCRNYCLD